MDWDAVKRFRENALNPNHPHSMGSAEQPETFFQHREACNKNYDDTVEIVAKYMDMVSEKTGKTPHYKPFNYYGAEDAEEVIVAMGSVCDAIEEAIDYANANGKKTGLVVVRLYRPFSRKYFLEALPDTVKKIAVLDLSLIHIYLLDSKPENKADLKPLRQHTTGHKYQSGRFHRNTASRPPKYLRCV